MTENIKLWGRSTSANVQKVFWLLDELGLEAEHIGADMRFGEASNSEIGSMNPNGLVPVLQHGDLRIWESYAIINYLAATFGAPAFWSDRPSERAIVDQWAMWGTATFSPALAGVFYAKVIAPPSKQDEATIAVALEKAGKAVAILDQQLSRYRFVAGAEFSIADIANGAFMHRWNTMDIDRPNTPNLDRWVKELKQRPGYQKWGQYSYETLRGKD